MALTAEQVAAMKAAIQEFESAPAISQPATVQTQVQQREPEPLSFEWGGQRYEARDSAELQNRLAEIQRQEQVARQSAEVQAQANAQRQAEQERLQQAAAAGRPAFDKEEYARLFLQNPVEAQDYINRFTPSYQNAVGTLYAKTVELEQNLAAEQFLRTNPDYTGSAESFQKLEGVRIQHNLPFTSAGLGMAFLVAKNSGLFPQPEAEPEPQANDVPEGLTDEQAENFRELQAQGAQQRITPPRAPRKKTASAAIGDDWLNRFENLSADKMRETIERMQANGIQ